MKNLTGWFCWVFAIITSQLFVNNLCATPILSDSSRISLLTCSPGEELYSAFGHTGIRITDYKNDFDVVFNYGTFDFSQPGFYTNFVKGKMRYMITTDRFSDFREQYVWEKRTVVEDEMSLPNEDKQKIFAFLYKNALPENREYYYEFFWDNCATRIRDVFEKNLGNRIQYNTEKGNFQKDKTMHDMLRVYVWNRPWVDYGFDLILGMPCEVAATPRNQTFLPDYLAEYFKCATVDGKPLVTSHQTLIKFQDAETDSAFTPLHLNLVLVFIGFVVWFFERRNKTHYFSFDVLLFSVTGLLGTLFLSLWMFTAHYSVPQNFNLLWLLPTHLVVAFILLKKQKPQFLKYYFAFTYFLMIAVFISWKWLPQPLNIAAMPLVFLLSFRSALAGIYLHAKK